MKERSSVKGHLKMNIIENGVIVKMIEQKNLVVTDGKRIIALLLGGASGQELTAVRYGIGTLPIDVSNSALNDPTELVFTDIYQYPDNDVPVNCVQFAFEMDLGTGNGKTFTECGLVNGSGTLFNRIVLNEPIVKMNTFSFQGFWTIEIL